MSHTGRRHFVSWKFPTKLAHISVTKWPNQGINDMLLHKSVFNFFENMVYENNFKCLIL